MSKVAIEGNALGTGTLTIAAPNTNSNFTLDIPSASGVIDRLNRAGNVLQVVSATKTDTFTTASTTFTDLTGLSVAITPSSASNKILIFSEIYFGSATSTATGFAQLVRDSTAIGNGASAGNRVACSMYTLGTTNRQCSLGSIFHLDSPNTTSSVTYKIQIRSQTGGFTTLVNRNDGDGNDDSVPRLSSNITIMEIAG